VNLFEHAICQQATKWVAILEMDGRQLSMWRKRAASCGIHANMSRLRISSNGEGLSVDAHALLQQIIPMAREIVESLVANSMIPFLYLLTDYNGVLCDYEATQETMDKLDGINVKVGTSFTLEDAGINAISLSMLAGERVYLSGDEHDLRLFHDWACLCSPITIDGMTVGYIDFSFHAKESPNHIMMVLSAIIDFVEQRLSAKSDKHAWLESRLDACHLTPREKEVAMLWNDNRSALYISTVLGITEGTIRNFIKSIYRKMGVQCKGEFLKRLMFTDKM